MNESNEKKQVAALWILGVLVVIFIAIIVGLFIKQAQAKNHEIATKDAKIAQMEQDLLQVKEQLREQSSKDNIDINTENTNLQFGRYKVIPDKNLLYNEGLGRTLDDLYIELKENNEFTFYDSWGNSYYGKFDIKGKNILLGITKWYGESGTSSTDTFTVEESAIIVLKANDGILEVIEAPSSIKVKRNNDNSKYNILNLKTGVKFQIPQYNKKNDITGEWKANKILDENGKEISLNSVFGSLIHDSNKLTFREDMTYINSVGGSGAGEGNEEGKYTITGNTITLEDLNHRIRILTYNESDDVLTEDYNGDGTRIVTYIRN